MLNVEDVSVRYGRIQAVRQVCLLVEPGEIVALLGANGAGKSSLMRTVAGLQSPSSGQVYWDGKRIDGIPSHQVVASGVVLVPEGRQLLPTMSVQENLLLGSYSKHVRSYRKLLGPIGLYLRGDSVQESLRYVFSLFPRLEERQSQLAGSLSGGEQQMLAIGRGLMASPSLLLLDEPSVGLAPNLVREDSRRDETMEFVPRYTVFPQPQGLVPESGLLSKSLPASPEKGLMLVEEVLGVLVEIFRREFP